MISVVQVVSHASVSVDKKIVGQIQHGILALIGFEKSDQLANTSALIDKIINYRIFPDENGKTNLSLQTVAGGLLLVPQFTLLAATDRGLRPSFSSGMESAEGKLLFKSLCTLVRERYHTVACGQFGANMSVALCNEGPMTFIIQG